MDSRDIYFNLDQERRRRGITIKEMAARCGISERTWTGYKAMPGNLTIGTIEKAANVMMIPMIELMKGRRRL